MIKSELCSREISKEFYDELYKTGYMNEWPDEKKKRILEIIKKLNLPETGNALDFGCGCGVFAKIIKNALPKWNVYGCDISINAVNEAKKHVDNCTFFTNDDPVFLNQKFDFIFTHHVLEHVFDINIIIEQMIMKASENAKMLHILPCGNKGSYEYHLCNLRSDGINSEIGNRFFYEDPGHIRRMSSDTCAELFSKYNFILKSEFYSNQYFGAINWITQSNIKLILTMFNPIKGKNLISKFKLLIMLLLIIIIKTLRITAEIYNRSRNLKKKKLKNIIIIALLFFPSLVANYLDNIVTNLSENEWNQRNRDRNGSEMYLLFHKN